MNLKQNILIFSVFQKTVSNESNLETHGIIREYLKVHQMPFIELEGSYNGVEELSFLVEGFEHRQRVEALSKVYNQESYLESHNDRKTFLVYKDRKVDIGTLVQVSEYEAKESGNYSFNRGTGQYFTTK